jgi:hypothetical protein
VQVKDIYPSAAIPFGPNEMVPFAMLSWFSQTAICSGVEGWSFSNHHTIAPTPACNK